MTRDELATLSRRMQRYADDRLVQMVSAGEAEFAPEALALAEKELRDRGYSDTAIDDIRRQDEIVAQSLRDELQQGLAWIRAADEVRGHCHLCQCASPTTSVAFGMAVAWTERADDRMLPTPMDIIALASFLTIGLGIFDSGLRTKRHAITLHLHICDDCRRMRTGWLDGLDLSESDCACHLAWDRAIQLGFAEFIPPRMIHRVSPPPPAGGSAEDG